MSEPSIEDYTIGWICALQEEYEASCRMLDAEFEGPETSQVNDNNTYVFGRINGHNVVIGCLPDGRYGTSSAAGVARDMVRSFPKLRFALMVGIGGGAPTRERDIRLGDVVVSTPHGTLGGTVQYDFGKRLSDGRFQRTGQLNAPPEVLLAAIPEMRRRHNDHKKPDRVAEHLKLMDDMPGFQRPAADRLYCADYEHKGGKSCANCEADGLEERPPRESSRAVIVHYGIIASANSVMKNAKERDQFATDPELNVLCFEMEAGGLMNNFPCLVIRGICDYSDSHKNDEWHNYAALAAAAYARELLHVLKPVRVTAMSPWVEKMKVLVTKVSKYIANQEDREILNWLTPTDYYPQHNDFVSMRQPGSGQWFLDSDEFQAWLNTDKQTLFCPGIPGAGKTIITAIVIDYLHSKFQDDQNTGIAYIYCNFRRQDVQKVEDLVASLLKQLACSRPTSVKDLYDRHQKNRTRPKFNEMCQTLQSVAAMYSRVFIVVDALDECQTSDGSQTSDVNRKSFLKEVFKLQANAVANIFATSRFNDNIASSFHGSLSQTISATDEDILTYLNERISLRTPKEPEIMDIDTQNMIRTGVLKAADGMFLLVALHTDTLLSQPTKGHLKESLQALGKGIEGLGRTYEQAMERIGSQEPNSRDLAKRILAWIVHSKRPLSTLELRHALAVRLHATELNADFLPTVSILRSLCAGLVTIDEESGIIRLVHYTTQEYFERTQESWFPNAQDDITEICVTYLSFSVFGSGFCRTDAELEERLWINPLFDYAAHNWGHHARKASTCCTSVTNFLMESPKVEASSQALMATKSSSSSDRRKRVPERVTGLHLAAYFGVREAVGILLQDWQNIDQKDSFGRTPLLYAAEKGYEAIIKLLLATDKVDVNTKDDRG